MVQAPAAGRRPAGSSGGCAGDGRGKTATDFLRDDDDEEEEEEALE